MINGKEYDETSGQRTQHVDISMNATNDKKKRQVTTQDIRTLCENDKNKPPARKKKKKDHHQSGLQMKMQQKSTPYFRFSTADANERQHKASNYPDLESGFVV